MVASKQQSYAKEKSNWKMEDDLYILLSVFVCDYYIKFSTYETCCVLSRG